MHFLLDSFPLFFEETERLAILNPFASTKRRITEIARLPTMTYIHTHMGEGMIFDNKKLAIMHAIMRVGRCLRRILLEHNESALSVVLLQRCWLAIRRLRCIDCPPRCVPARPMRHAIGDAKPVYAICRHACSISRRSIRATRHACFVFVSSLFRIRKGPVGRRRVTSDILQLTT